MNNKKLPKILALSTLLAVPAFFLGNTITKLATNSQYIYSLLSEPQKIAGLFFILVALGPTAALPFTVRFQQKNKLSWLVILIPAGSIVLFPMVIHPRALLTPILSGIIFSLSLIWLKGKVRGKTKNLVKIKGGQHFRRHLKYFYIFIAVTAAVSFIFGHTLELREQSTVTEVPKNLTEDALESVMSTVEQHLETQIQPQLRTQFIQQLPVENGEVPPELQREQQLTDTTQNKEVPETTDFDQSSTLPELTDHLQQEIKKIIEPYRDYIVLGLGVALFLTVYFLSKFALIFTPIILSLLLYLAKKTKFFKTQKREIKAERLTI